jgi:DNA polymerase-3 subunit alpha
MPALAITDLSNLFGAVKFYTAARGKGVKPVVGCDCWLTNPDDRDKPFRILLLTQDREGYLRLCRWLTRAFRENQHRGRAELDREWLREDGTAGLIALSGGSAGDIGQALVAGNADRADALARDWQTLFPGRFYLEFQRAGHPESAAIEPALLALAARLRLPPVATHPIQFIDADQFQAHEARVCIAEGTCCPTSAGRDASRCSSTSRRRTTWRSASPTCRPRSRTPSRSRSAATSS